MNKGNTYKNVSPREQTILVQVVPQALEGSLCTALPLGEHSLCLVVVSRAGTASFYVMRMNIENFTKIIDSKMTGILNEMPCEWE